jgi:type IX secretion system substrate protein/beta-propeller repeat-containing protein
MRKVNIIVALFILSSSLSVAQNRLSVEWLINSTGESWDLVSDMQIDQHNNIYIIGNISESLQKGKTANKHKEYKFVAKYNQQGEKLWKHKLKDNSYYRAKSLVANNNYCLVSTFVKQNEEKTGTKTQTQHTTNLLIEKIDDSGLRNAFCQLQGDFITTSVKMIPLKNNRLIVSGVFRSIFHDNTTFKSKGNKDIFIFSCDEEGKNTKLIILSGLGNNELQDIITDNNDNIYLTGSMEKEMSLEDTILRSKGKKDLFLTKFNSNLMLIYVKQIGSLYNDYGKSIQTDSLNNLYLCGSFSGEFKSEIGNPISSGGKLDIVVVKYDESGKMLWINSFGGEGNDYISSCFLNSKNDIYVTGNYRGTIENEDYSITSAGFSSDVFIAKYNSVGQFCFLESIGDTNTDFVSRIITDSLDFIYLAGNFTKNTKVISDTTTRAANEDYYLTKLYDCDFSRKIKLQNDTSLCDDKFVIIADSGFVNYLWNGNTGDNKLTVDSTGNYYVDAYDEHGCITSDSIFVQINEPVQVDLGDDISIVQGEPVLLITNGDFEKYLWSTSDTTPIINMETTHIPPGNYPIEVLTTDTNNCTSTDNIIMEILDKSTGMPISIEVFPNPTSDNITLTINNLKDVKMISYQVVSETGVVLYRNRQPAFENKFSKLISFGFYEPGVYYLKVETGNLQSIHKILKLK